MKRFRIFTAIIVVLVSVSAGLMIARPFLLRWAVERALTGALGGDIELGILESSLRQGRLSLHDLRVINPADWPTDAEWLIREITVEYDWRTLFAERVRLREVVLDIQQITMVVDMDGLTSLQNAATGRKRRAPGVPAVAEVSRLEDPEGSESPRHDQASARRQQESKRQLQIDRLDFRLGRIDMYNALFGEVDDEAVPIILNLEQTFYNVEDMDQVVQALTRSLLFALPSRR